MSNDFFLVDIPEFIPEYDEKRQYGYGDTQLKKQLVQLLCSTFGGYCMYCYNSVKINGNIYADLEHGIEKSIDNKIFENCIPNISISCSKCNQKYKRLGEKKRISYMKEQKKEIIECRNIDCKQLCHQMVELRKKYVENGKILIYPFGNCIIDKNKLEIQYDLLNAKYIPSKKYDYTKHEREVIENHIKLFHLNSPERRNREVSLYCKNVINQKSLLLDVRYNNYIVDLFRKKLKKLNSISKSIEICKIVYFMNFIKMAT